MQVHECFPRRSHEFARRTQHIVDHILREKAVVVLRHRQPRTDRVVFQRTLHHRVILRRRNIHAEVRAETVLRMQPEFALLRRLEVEHRLFKFCGDRAVVDICCLRGFRAGRGLPDGRNILTQPVLHRGDHPHHPADEQQSRRNAGKGKQPSRGKIAFFSMCLPRKSRCRFARFLRTDLCERRRDIGHLAAGHDMLCDQRGRRKCHKTHNILCFHSSSLPSR